MSDEPSYAEPDDNDLSLAEKDKQFAVVQAAEPMPVQLFPGDEAAAFNRMRALVREMADLVRAEGESKYISYIEGRPFPQVTWWTTISLPLNLVPRTVWTKRLDTLPDGGYSEETWQARVEVVHIPTQNVVAAGEAICSGSEQMYVKAKRDWVPRWRDSHAIQAMAQTRAIGRAYRGPLAGLARLAGLEPTPAEEMREDMVKPPDEGAPASECPVKFKPGQRIAAHVTYLQPKPRWKKKAGGKYQKGVLLKEYPDLLFLTLSNPESRRKADQWELHDFVEAYVEHDEDKQTGADIPAIWQWQGKWYCRIEHVRRTEEGADGATGEGAGADGDTSEPKSSGKLGDNHPATTPPPQPKPDDLDGMTLNQLKAEAAKVEGALGQDAYLELCAMYLGTAGPNDIVVEPQRCFKRANLIDFIRAARAEI